jgi:hypothetical protein
VAAFLLRSLEAAGTTRLDEAWSLSESENESRNLDGRMTSVTKRFFVEFDFYFAIESNGCEKRFYPIPHLI